jgi:hypothetical protein
MTSMRVLMSGRLAAALIAAAVFTGTALGGAGDPEKRAIRPADQSWAKRVNLSYRDVPSGFLQQGAAGGSGSGSGFTCGSFAPDLSGFTITGQATSAAFTRPDGTTIFSAAEIFRSAADERGDWAASARPQALPCVAKMLADQLRGTLPVRIVARTIRRAPRLGQRAISFRIVGATSASGTSVKLWFDILGVSRGRADATLAMITVRHAPSAKLENSLLAKLTRRLAR